MLTMRDLYCKECGRYTRHYLVEDQPAALIWECSVCGLVKKLSKPLKY